MGRNGAGPKLNRAKLTAGLRSSAAREPQVAAHELVTILGFALGLFTRPRAELLEHIETATTVGAVNPRRIRYLIDTPEVLIAGEASDLERVVGIGDIEDQYAVRVPGYPSTIPSLLSV